MKRKLILFDLDGTLIDSSEGIFKSALYALEHYGIKESDMESLRRFIGPPLSDSFVNYYNFERETAIEAVDVFRERYNVLGYRECCLYPGVKETLELLKNQGIALGVATSKPEITACAILKDKQIYDLFDEVSGATMDGKIETKSQVIEELYRRMPDYRPEDTVLVGDTEFDVLGANKFGIRTIGVSFGFGEVDKMLEAGAIAICDSMEAVGETILSL